MNCWLYFFVIVQVISVTIDNPANMKAAFSTCLPSWEIAEENDLDEAENEDESQMDNFVELDLHSSEFSENECYKVIELDLQAQFNFHTTSHRTSELRLDVKVRGACLAHTTQLVVKNALAASEVLHGFLSQLGIGNPALPVVIFIIVSSYPVFLLYVYGLSST